MMGDVMVALPSTSPVGGLPARDCAGCDAPIYVTLAYVARIVPWLNEGRGVRLICHECAATVEPVAGLVGDTVEWFGADEGHG